MKTHCEPTLVGSVGFPVILFSRVFCYRKTVVYRARFGVMTAFQYHFGTQQSYTHTYTHDACLLFDQHTGTQRLCPIEISKT